MTRWLVLLPALSVVQILACSSDSGSEATGGAAGTATSGGAQSDGGASTDRGGATTSGGSGVGGGSSGATNGGSSGAATTGGVSDSGGSAGKANGGSAGKANGGSSGAATSGGSSGTGGKASGGSSGSGTGGKASGGSAGAATGGATGGGGAGGVATGGSGGAASGDVCRGTKAGGFVAEGLCAVQVGTVAKARQITFSSNGDLWVTNTSGQIRRLRDANGNGTFESGEIIVWATTGGNGQNSHIDEAGGFLYSGSTAGVKRFPWTPSSESGGAGEDVMTGQPGSGGHPKHTVHVWDGYMYVMSGSSGNVSNENTNKAEYDTSRSVIKRFQLSSFQPGTPLTWSSGEVFVRGVRNVLGFNRDAMGRMYGVQNGQDNVRYGGADVHNDNPGEAVLRLEMGGAHGYPFCFVAQQITGITAGTQVTSEIYPNNTRDNAWCQNATNVVKPVTFTQAHSAPMDIVFFTGTSTTLPSKYLNGAFISLHGSWNRSPASGRKVVWVPFNADGTSPMPTVSGTSIGFPYEVIMGANSDKIDSGSAEAGFRPVGLAISPVDGALYVSSDDNGAIYRIGATQ